MAPLTRECPTADHLATYLDGGLLPPGRRRIEAHLAGCLACCATLAGAVSFLLEADRFRREARPALVS